MKKQYPKPTRSKFPILRQLCNLIPPFLVSKSAREKEVDKKARTFSVWSHFVSLMYAQLTHAISLNDVCDGLQLNSGDLSTLRGATPPSRSNLSYANATRDAAVAEDVFWKVLSHLQELKPGFARGRGRPTRRFKRAIHAVDSSTIKLIMSCFSWAQHRRRKAAAKLHLRLNLQSFLPSYAIVDKAKGHDSQKARELCCGLKSGEIAVFDMAYVTYEHLNELTHRGVWWVSRVPVRSAYRVVKKLQRKAEGKILRDDLIRMTGPKTKTLYPDQLRRVVALVEIEGQEVEMEFLTNNLDWSAQSIADLYKCRWQIEVFFKQIKQTLQLADFLGHNLNAVRWQIWTALLTYVLLRFMAFSSQCNQSFARVWAFVRSGLWKKVDLLDLLRNCCGTAGKPKRLRAAPEQAYLLGF
jgi:RNAse (barnase) inhibitor barstar